MVRPARGARRVVGRALALVLLVVVVLILWSPWIPVPGGVGGLDEVGPFVQLVAFRWQTAALLLGLGAVVVVVAVLRRRWAVAAAVEVALLVVVLPALPAGLPVRDADPAPPAARVDARVTVLAANMLGSDGDPAAVVAEARRRGATVLALTETSRALAADIRDELPGGEDAWASTTALGGRSTRPRIGSTALLVRRTLRPGRLQPGAGTALGEARATIRVGRTRQLVVAAHPPPPITGVRGVWRRELRRLADLCDAAGRGRPHVVVAGDLNTPPASSRMRALRRAGCAETTAGVGGTWQSAWPRFARTQIDHVVASDPAWSSVDAGSAPTPQSDHRMVWATLVHEDPTVSAR